MRPLFSDPITLYPGTQYYTHTKGTKLVWRGIKICVLSSIEDTKTCLSYLPPTIFFPATYQSLMKIDLSPFFNPSQSPVGNRKWKQSEIFYPRRQRNTTFIQNIIIRRSSGPTWKAGKVDLDPILSPELCNRRRYHLPYQVIYSPLPELIPCCILCCPTYQQLLPNTQSSSAPPQQMNCLGIKTNLR